MKAKVESLHVGSDSEHRRISELYHAGFTPWYPGLPSRQILNTLAEVLPECFLQIDTGLDLPSGYIFTLPIYWNQDPSTLETFDFYTVDRFKGQFWRDQKFISYLSAASYIPMPKKARLKLVNQLREMLLHKANSLMIMAMIIKPEARGNGLSQVFFDHFKTHLGSQLSLKSVVGPFRPSGFGHYKMKHQISLSRENFHKYCHGERNDGLLQDPWLRSAQQNGVEFMQCETRSVRVTRALSEFEKFRKIYKPDVWHEVTPSVWECGEVPTWYVDENNNRVYSLEPNIWGRVDLS